MSCYVMSCSLPALTVVCLLTLGSQFIAMDRKSDVGGTNSHPGFLVSKGLVKQTADEHDRMRVKFGLALREK